MNKKQTQSQNTSSDRGNSVAPDNDMIKSESRIQQEIFTWYHNTHCLPSHAFRSLILHIPNQRQMSAINIGMYPGAADLLIIHSSPPIMCVLFVEVKSETGKQQPKQIAFEKHCKDIGTPYHVVRSLDEFRTIIHGLNDIYCQGK